ncbi:MAG: hypothetical protein V8R92_00525 [Eubacterium sp.]|uniref:hypothetical protein n=1 Tax=Eubacterium sp. TaxID=142586 RepID=UPI00300F50C2
MDKKKKLVEAILDEDFDKTFNILQEIYNNDNGSTYVEFLIIFIMDNPDIDYGMPGPIVHFIEKYPIDYYISLLLKTIEQKPNDTLLWMLNRITNVSDGSKKEKYIEIFKYTIERKDIDEMTRDAAIRFYKYQSSSNV